MKNNLLFKILSLLSILSVCTDLSLPQSSSIKLPTNNHTSSFDITQNVGTNIFRVFGDAGFYAAGTLNSGTIPITGGGTRLMWYPGKAAFRAGRVSDNRWDDAYVGDYSVAMGYNTRASGVASVAMGLTASASGNSAISLGRYTTASGNGSMAFGTYASTNGHSGSLVIGDNTTVNYADPTYQTIKATANNQVTMRFDGSYVFYSDKNKLHGVYLGHKSTGWTSASDSTKKENFLNADGEYFLSSLLKIRLGSWNYKSQDPKKFRHYGPMAQDIFHYFGKDEYGTIGCDTALSTLNMDGIMMICLKALSKRTEKIGESKKQFLH